MRTHRTLVIALACLLSLSLVTCQSPSVEPVPSAAGPAEAAAEVIELADRYVEAYFETFPASATAEGIATADHGRLPDLSEAGLAPWRALEDELLASLRSVDFDQLSAEARITAEFLLEQLEASIGWRACRMELWNVSPTWTGWQSELAFIASIQPIASSEERQQALDRARALVPYLQREIDNLTRGVAAGITAPRNNVDRVIEQTEALLTANPQDSPFADPARRAEDPDFAIALHGIIEHDVNPAVQAYLEFLQTTYRSAAREEIGVTSNPEGEACYRAAVRYHSSLELSAEQIHATGLEQMERITAEMQAIGERSFGTSDVAELLRTALTDPRYTFSDRQEIVDYAQAAIDRMRGRIPDWFGLVPEAEVAIVPYPPFREKSAPGAEYMAAPDDGSRPATYLINTYRPTEQSKAGVEATAFHEAYPGHHLQIAIAKERGSSHAVQRYFGSSGFSEGWALYTERLAAEMEAYGGDIDRLGLLSNEALRAGRLVVDSGMHALGWSRQQAVEYLSSHTAESPASVQAEIDRYIAVPGQATAYMLGALEIRRLRDRVEAAQGDRFDVRSFHDRVLEDGAVTLSMLGQKIDRWLAESEGAEP